MLTNENVFAQRLKDLRLLNNLSHSALACKLNLSRSVVGHWENGVRLPSIEVLLNLADLFFVSLDYLTGRCDDPRHEEYVCKAEESLLEEMFFIRFPDYYRDQEIRKQNYSIETRLKIITILREILTDQTEGIAKHYEAMKKFKPSLLNGISKYSKYQLEKLGLIAPTVYTVDFDERDRILQRNEELARLLKSGTPQEKNDDTNLDP